MTDYEMLSLAAEAMRANHDPRFANFTVLEDGSAVCLELGCRPGAITSYWKPHRDPTDALHTATTLGLTVVTRINSLDGTPSCTAYIDWVSASRPRGDNPIATVCQVITQAAAELGEYLQRTEKARQQS